jgi:hypothetical protein
MCRKEAISMTTAIVLVMFLIAAGGWLAWEFLNAPVIEDECDDHWLKDLDHETREDSNHSARKQAG